MTNFTILVAMKCAEMFKWSSLTRNRRLQLLNEFIWGQGERVLIISMTYTKWPSKNERTGSETRTERMDGWILFQICDL